MTPRALLERGLAELALPLPADAQARLEDYAALLEKWNRTYNLTAIRDPLKIMTHHLLDSLCVVRYLPPGALADVGSGGGLPGIPIAIAEPARRVAINDANAKKAAFLKQAKIELALDNLTVHEGRVEQWQPAQGFDAVITRGFAELADFVASCRHLRARGGLLLAMKGAYPRDEIARLPGDVDADDIVALRVPQLDAERHLVRMRLRAA
ncbi:MAG: 16S rRNA (guanine(527)-N(7))-methyltransferase RsmG [Betaproteobacteria bacterium]|nr:16S rRNA (guanine(527)-N(7))-methyltransferase RsmG [Betaproteobacteria bacterium]